MTKIWLGEPTSFFCFELQRNFLLAQPISCFSIGLFQPKIGSDNKSFVESIELVLLVQQNFR